MDFELSEEQRLLKDSVDRLMADRYDFEKRARYSKEPEGWSRDLWSAYAELGLLALPFDEAHGGFGGGPLGGAALHVRSVGRSGERQQDQQHGGGRAHGGVWNRPALAGYGRASADLPVAEPIALELRQSELVEAPKTCAGMNPCTSTLMQRAGKRWWMQSLIRRWSDADRFPSSFPVVVWKYRCRRSQHNKEKMPPPVYVCVCVCVFLPVVTDPCVADHDDYDAVWP